MNDMALRVIALAGRAGSGKSSLAHELKQRRRVHTASFGAFVRAEAKRRSVGLDVPSLQRLGQELIDQLGPDAFVRQVIDWGLSVESEATSADPVLILDGVRSQEIWHAVQRVATNSLLVYLDVDQKIREERIVQRGNISLASLKQALTHPMEAGVPELRAEADLILREGDINIWTSRVMEIMAT